jgi:hypothetical protein
MDYKRNPDVIKSILVERGAGCIVKRDVTVHVPIRFTEVSLAEMSSRVYVYG